MRNSLENPSENFSENFSPISQSSHGSQINVSMLQHLFKLVWNRKRANALIVAELLAAFLVLVGVCTTIIHFTKLYVQPLGYDYKDTWNILAYRKDLSKEPVNTSTGGLDRKSKTAEMQSARNILATLKALPEVESCGFEAATPFSFSHSLTDFNRGEKYRTEQLNTTDDVRETLNLTVTKGRWFNASDDQYNGTTATIKPIVLNEVAATLFFGEENPLGKDLSYLPGKGIDKDLERRRFRVVGVISDFRRGSAFDQSNSLMFRRVSLLDTTAWLPSQLLVKMKSRIDAGYEQKLLNTLQQTAPDWEFQISTLETDRARKHRVFGIATGIGLTIAAFLLLMVALGLVGVVWQSVMRRMRELGVRRAFGATKADVMFFVVGELAALTTFAVALGAVVLAQFPLIPFFDVPTITYITSIGVAIVALYALTALCALYPSRLAGTVQPSDALRYE
jgi:putative ABC transport system permease protein